MAVKRGKWNPSLHPRDARGRFTRSSTRTMKGSDTTRARSALAGFSPAKVASQGDARAWMDRKGGGQAPAADSAMGQYLAGGWRETNPAIRANKTPPPGVAEIDAEFGELDEDVMLRRQVPVEMFAHIPIKDLEGMKVRDAAYASTSIDTPDAGPSAADAVTMHIAAAAGTPAYVNAPDGEILLARDTEIAITRAEPNGRGGWDLYGAIIPKTATKRPRANDKKDGVELSQAPAGTSSPDGASSTDGNRDAVGGSGRGSAETPRAAAAPDNEPAPATAANAGAGTARRRQNAQDDAGDGDQQTGDTSPAAGTNGPDVGERGPLPDDGPLGEFPRLDRERIRVAVEDHAARMFASPWIGGSRENTARYVAEGPLTKLTDREGLSRVWNAVDQVLGDRPELMTRSPEESERAAAARAERVESMASQAAQLTKSGDYTGAMDLIDQAETMAPDHLVGTGKTLRTRSWDDLRAIVRRRQEKEPAEPAGDATPDTAGDQTPAVPNADVDLDAVGEQDGPGIVPVAGALAELPPIDRERVRIAVEDNAGRIFRTPMMGGTPGNVARYVAESRDLAPVTNRHGFRPTVNAVSQILAERPELMNLSDEDVEAVRAARNADATARAEAASNAITAGDFTTARAAVDAGETAHPDFTLDLGGPPLDWAAIRRIVDEAEADTSRTPDGDRTPAATPDAPDTTPLVPAGTPVADLKDRDRARVSGVDQYGQSISGTGYVQGGAGTVNTVKRGKKTGEKRVVQLSEYPDGLAGWRMTVYTDMDATTDAGPDVPAADAPDTAAIGTSAPDAGETEPIRLDAAAGGFTPPARPDVTGRESASQRREKLGEVETHLTRLDQHIRQYEQEPGLDHYSDQIRSAHDEARADFDALGGANGARPERVAQRVDALMSSLRRADTVARARDRRAALVRSANPDPMNVPDDAVLAIEDVLQGPDVDVVDKTMLEAAAQQIEDGVPIATVAKMVGNVAEKGRVGARAAAATRRLRTLHARLTGTPAPTPAAAAAAAGRREVERRTGRPVPSDTTPAAGTSAPKAATDVEQRRRDYERGWNASRRNANLDHADYRGEPDAWYEGYGDHATGRAKWSALDNTPPDAADRPDGEGDGGPDDSPDAGDGGTGGTPRPTGPGTGPAGPAQQADIFGGTTEFVPASRSAIGLADRANVGRDRQIAVAQQLGMFDLSHLDQMDGQGELLDFKLDTLGTLMDMPGGDAATPPPAPSAPEPTAAASIVPDDLSGWTDEQLGELFRRVTDDDAQADEVGAGRIFAEWERREAGMANLVASVPEDLTALPEDEVMGLYARLTSELGTMDHPTVERVGVELDRRQEAERLAEESAPKRALLDRPVSELTDDEIETAREYAADLDDVAALERVYVEWERRDQEREAAAERERIEVQARERAEREAAVLAAQEAERAAAVEHAQAQRDRMIDAMAAAQDAAIVPAYDDNALSTASASLGGEDGVRGVLGDDVVDGWVGDIEPERKDARTAALSRGLKGLTTNDRIRLVAAAADRSADEELRDSSDQELHSMVTRGMFVSDSNPDAANLRTWGRRAQREKSRRKIQDLRSGNTREFRQYQIRAMAADPASLSTDELEVAPALVAATGGGDDFDVPARLGALRAEARRREAAADQAAEAKAAGPAAPARYFNPVQQYGTVRGMLAQPRTRQDRESADRLRRAQAAVYGLSEDADAKAIKAAEKKDPRPVADQAVAVMAWYRHLAQHEGVADNASIYDRGIPDDPDVPDTPTPEPAARVANADDVWNRILAQARIDRADGRHETARRVLHAIARTYRIPAEDAEDTEADIQRLQDRISPALRHDDRTPKQRAADFIAQYRRLAADDDIDPSDTLRYGPPDKGTARPRRAPTRPSTPEQEKRIDELVARGWDWLDAYAEVHGVDRAAVEGRAAGGRSGMSEKQLRQAYAEHVELQFRAAESATNGYLLKKGSKVDARTLFSGPWKTAQANASEELLRWWAEHQRLTYADFKAQIVGGDAARASRERLVSAGKGNQFA